MPEGSDGEAEHQHEGPDETAQAVAALFGTDETEGDDDVQAIRISRENDGCFENVTQEHETVTHDLPFNVHGSDSDDSGDERLEIQDSSESKSPAESPVLFGTAPRGSDLDPLAMAMAQIGPLSPEIVEPGSPEEPDCVVVKVGAASSSSNFKSEGKPERHPKNNKFSIDLLKNCLKGMGPVARKNDKKDTLPEKTKQVGNDTTVIPIVSDECADKIDKSEKAEVKTFDKTRGKDLNEETIAEKDASPSKEPLKSKDVVPLFDRFTSLKSTEDAPTVPDDESLDNDCVIESVETTSFCDRSSRCETETAKPKSACLGPVTATTSIETLNAESEDLHHVSSVKAVVDGKNATPTISPIKVPKTAKSTFFKSPDGVVCFRYSMQCGCMVTARETKPGVYQFDPVDQCEEHAKAENAKKLAQNGASQVEVYEPGELPQVEQKIEQSLRSRARTVRRTGAPGTSGTPTASSKTLEKVHSEDLSSGSNKATLDTQKQPQHSLLASALSKTSRNDSRPHTPMYVLDNSSETPRLIGQPAVLMPRRNPISVLSPTLQNRPHTNSSISALGMTSEPSKLIGQPSVLMPVERAPQKTCYICYSDITGKSECPNCLSCLKCAQCGMIFQTTNALSKHQKSAHSKYKCPYCFNELKCGICGLRFHQFEDLIRHRELYHESSSTEPIKCFVCRKELTLKESAPPEHIMRSQPAALADGAFECEICDRTFDIEDNLTTHMRTVHDNEVETEVSSGSRFNCGLCHMSFSCSTKLIQHLESNHKNDVCATRNQARLVAKVGAAPQPFIIVKCFGKPGTARPCNRCSDWVLSDYPHRCYCDRTPTRLSLEDFNTGSVTIGRTHRVRRPRQPREPTEKTQSKAKESKKDQPDESTRCPRCNRIPKPGRLHTKHQCKKKPAKAKPFDTSHEKSSQNDESDITTIFKWTTTENGDIQLLCEYCEKSFPNLQKLKKHLRMIHKKTLKCSICGKRDSLDRLDKCSTCCINEMLDIKCTLCGHGVQNMRALKFHYVKAHKKIAHICERCDAQFITEVALKDHVKKDHKASEHNGSEPESESSESDVEITEQMDSRSQENGDDSDFAVSSSENTVEPIQNDSVPRPGSSSTSCDNSTQDSATANDNVTDEKPLCALCGAGFDDSVLLISHLRHCRKKSHRKACITCCKFSPLTVLGSVTGRFKCIKCWEKTRNFQVDSTSQSIGTGQNHELSDGNDDFEDYVNDNDDESSSEDEGSKNSRNSKVSDVGMVEVPHSSDEEDVRFLKPKPICVECRVREAFSSKTKLCSQCLWRPKCDMCGVRVKNICGLQKHYKTKHGKTSHKCHICNVRFDFPADLKIHLAKRHGKMIPGRRRRIDSQPKNLAKRRRFLESFLQNRSSSVETPGYGDCDEDEVEDRAAQFYRSLSVPDTAQETDSLDSVRMRIDDDSAEIDYDSIERVLDNRLSEPSASMAGKKNRNSENSKSVNLSRFVVKLVRIDEVKRSSCKNKFPFSVKKEPLSFHENESTLSRTENESQHSHESSNPYPDENDESQHAHETEMQYSYENENLISQENDDQSSCNLTENEKCHFSETNSSASYDFVLKEEIDPLEVSGEMKKEPVWDGHPDDDTVRRNTEIFRHLVMKGLEPKKEPS